MKIKVINELAPAAAPAATMAAAAGTAPVAAQPATAAQPAAAAAAATPHPLDPTLVPVVKKQLIDALNPLTNAYIKSAIDKTLDDVLKKIQVK